MSFQGFHHCSSEDTFAHTTQDAIVFVKSGAELVAGEVREFINHGWSTYPPRATYPPQK